MKLEIEVLNKHLPGCLRYRIWASVNDGYHLHDIRKYVMNTADKELADRIVNQFNLLTKN